MTIFERALEMVPPEAVLGLGSGRAAAAFVHLLGEQVRAGRLRVRGVPTSTGTAELAREVGVPLVGLDEAGALDLTVDGADEAAPNLDLIKGYGRALVREKIVAYASRRLVILVGEEKLVPRLGSRGRLPVEVVPFALAVCRRALDGLGLQPEPYEAGGELFITDNGNHILDCRVGPIDDPAALEQRLRAVPGVVGTGLFLGLTDTVLVGDRTDFTLLDEHRARR